MQQLWRATASLENIQQRALLYAKIRQFFHDRNVLEVETPVLSHYGITDVYLENIYAHYRSGLKQETAFLQTSPEYAMKRLLADGVGSIFQICKSFRNDEKGKFHNPEFTMLEWYRLDFDHHDLMQEVDAFLQFTLQCQPAKFLSYENIFFEYLKLNPHFCSLSECLDLIEKYKIHLSSSAKNIDIDTALQLLMSHIIEPNLGFEVPIFIYDFPSSQAALAKISPQNPQIAHRFEVYMQGMELANGFHELTDADEQLQRLQRDQTERELLGLNSMEIDSRFIAALEEGLPECAGVALGIDRLLMILTQEKDINNVITFPWGRA